MLQECALSLFMGCWFTLPYVGYALLMNGTHL